MTLRCAGTGTDLTVLPTCSRFACLAKQRVVARCMAPIEPDDLSTPPPPSPPPSISSTLISPDFAIVAQAQLEVLAAALPVSRAAVYMRRENPTTGSLEFVPACVWPQTQGVWVVGAGPQGLASVPAPHLPGGASASALLPSYPFIKPKRESQSVPGYSFSAAVMDDEGLSAPLVYDSVVMGVLAVWRAEGGRSVGDAPQEADATEADITGAAAVAGGINGDEMGSEAAAAAEVAAVAASERAWSAGQREQVERVGECSGVQPHASWGIRSHRLKYPPSRRPPSAATAYLTF